MLEVYHFKKLLKKKSKDKLWFVVKEIEEERRGRKTSNDHAIDTRSQV